VSLKNETRFTLKRTLEIPTCCVRVECSTLLPVMKSQTADAAKGPKTVREFCLSVLTVGTLSAKLAAPRDEDGKGLPDIDRGEPIYIESPERVAGLRMPGGSDRLPRPGQLRHSAHRIRCLSRFAHHELMAVELFAWALLRWPNLPKGLRRGLLSALVDEQRHCRLYLDRLAAHGGRFDTDDHSDYFWQQLPAIEKSKAGPRAFLAAMGLTLEQANLDFTLTYRDGFAEAGDHESAAVCQLVHNEEIPHVALAVHWIRLLGDEPQCQAADPSDLEAYQAAVPFPLGASRAKGRRFEKEPRRRAGLSEEFIEFVRTARSSPELNQKTQVATALDLLPNLGAEEGDDWRAYTSQPRVRMAARLWALLFEPDACLTVPEPGVKRAWTRTACRALWPSALGPLPNHPVFEWLRLTDGPLAWLNTQSLEANSQVFADSELAGPSATLLAAVHDKAFAVRTAAEMGLHSADLASMIRVIDPEEFQSPDRLIQALEAALHEWPDWTEHAFTLKPRQGSSGRGRVAGTEHFDRESIRGAFPRLASRGGAILEPWLKRSCDLSVSMFVPGPEQQQEPTTILGSLEMIVTASGGYRGHCGEVDARGRIFSGHPEDEKLRVDAVSVAGKARQIGFFGPCGVDAFGYLEQGHERLRSLVEFNARTTMGTVIIGLVRRALPHLRKTRDLTPGDRHGFLVTFIDPNQREALDELIRDGGTNTLALALTSPGFESETQPYLLFAHDLRQLRQAHQTSFGC
ncbi:MAG: DUF455 family protein, partial [Myxococcota bacterium]